MLAKLRVHHAPPVANIVEDHHASVLHAACGCYRVSGVMATTLSANAQELQVSTTAEENARDASAWGSRAASSPQTIASMLEKLQPALQKSRIDRATIVTHACEKPSGSEVDSKMVIFDTAEPVSNGYGTVK